MVDLIILDLFGTIVKADKNDFVIRNGLREFLASYSNVKKAVFSDADNDSIEYILKGTQIEEYFDGIYGAPFCIAEGAYKLKDEKLRVMCSKLRGNVKNLGKVCVDFSVSPGRAVYIGDNFENRDKKSAEFNVVPFIQVPQFRENPPSWEQRDRTQGFIVYDDKRAFSFQNLIGKI